MDEPDLIQRSRQGDRQAFAALVERFWDPLFRWIHHLARDQHQAEDVVQEAFLRAFSGLPSFRENTHFRAWLFRIAFNTFLKQRRPATKVVAAFPDDWPGSEPDPAEHAMNRETLRHLARAVGRLPADFRAAFLLRVDEELSFKEVAHVLGITEETARWRVFKARQKLVEVMKDHLPELDS